MNKNWRALAAAATLMTAVSIILPTGVALAVPVPALPSGNLLDNPWFRSTARPNQPGLDGWLDAAGTDARWSTSQKDSNPSPDGVQGTSCRFADGSGQGGGTGVGGVDAYLFQVVAADSAARQLTFFTHWVTGWIEIAAVTIAGGDAAGGPFTEVWTPLSINSATGSNHAWTNSGMLSRTLGRGYAYYRVELHARYPVGRAQGAKFTGIYLTTGGSSAGEVDGGVPGGPGDGGPPASSDGGRIRRDAGSAIRDASMDADGGSGRTPSAPLDPPGGDAGRGFTAPAPRGSGDATAVFGGDGGDGAWGSSPAPAETATRVDGGCSVSRSRGIWHAAPWWALWAMAAARRRFLGRRRRRIPPS